MRSKLEWVKSLSRERLVSLIELNGKTISNCVQLQLAMRNELRRKQCRPALKLVIPVGHRVNLSVTR